MSTKHSRAQRRIGGWLAALAVLAILVTACGSAAQPGGAASSPTAVGPVESRAIPSSTSIPIPSKLTPTPGPTRAPSPTTTPRPTPTVAVAPSTAPSPGPAAVTSSDDWVWVYEKRPLTLRGGPGTTTWTKVLFAANTVVMRWKATPASSAGCTFRYRIESSALPKAARASERIKGAKAATGTRSLTTKYADGVVTVTTDCARFILKLTSAGHPGVVIKQANDPFQVTGTTPDALNDGLAEAFADWSFTTNTRYYDGRTIRVSSMSVTATIDYELPKWTPPEGSDPALIEAWDTALANMRRHIEGEAAIAIQAAGRYVAAATKRSFTSLSAMDKYHEGKADRQFDWARDKNEAYDEATDYGWTQAAYIP